MSRLSWYIFNGCQNPASDQDRYRSYRRSGSTRLDRWFGYCTSWMAFPSQATVWLGLGRRLTQAHTHLPKLSIGLGSNCTITEILVHALTTLEVNWSTKSGIFYSCTELMSHLCCSLNRVGGILLVDNAGDRHSWRLGSVSIHAIWFAERFHEQGHWSVTKGQDNGHFL